MTVRNPAIHFGAAILIIVCAIVTAITLHGCSDTNTSMTGSLPVEGLFPGCLAFNCHPAAPLSIYPPVSGEHKSHRAGGDYGLSLTCTDCHYKYDRNKLHKNGFINGYNWLTKSKTSGEVIYFDPLETQISPGASFDHTASTCTGTGANCHGGGASDNWYNGAGGTCGNSSSCHLGPPLNQYPPATGAHAIHRYKNTSCVTCHYQYYANATHKNGSVNGSALDPKATVTSSVVFFDPAKTTGSWNNGTAGCSSLSAGCHGDRNWYSYTSASECPVCHVYPPLYQYPPTSGQHGLHRGQGYDCLRCHYNYAAGGYPNHNNGVVNGSSFDPKATAPGTTVYFNGAGTYSTANGNCSSLPGVSCHGTENWWSGGN